MVNQKAKTKVLPKGIEKVSPHYTFATLAKSATKAQHKCVSRGLESISLKIPQKPSRNAISFLQHIRTFRLKQIMLDKRHTSSYFYA